MGANDIENLCKFAVFERMDTYGAFEGIHLELSPTETVARIKVHEKALKYP